MAFFNPTSKNTIRLPSANANNFIGLKRNQRFPLLDEALPHPYLPVTKAVFSISYTTSDPGNPVLNSDDLTVMITHKKSSRLAFARPSDESWTLINYRLRVRSFRTDDDGFEDIIFYQQHFHAVGERGIVYRCELYTNAPMVVPIAPFPSRHFAMVVEVFRYLVESSGCLFQVRRAFRTSRERCDIEDNACHEWARVSKEAGYRLDDLDDGEDPLTAIDNEEDGSHIEWVHNGLPPVQFSDDEDDDDEDSGKVVTEYERLDPDLPFLAYKGYNKFPDYRQCKTLCFDVFRLNLEGRRWVQANSLEG